MCWNLFLLWLQWTLYGAFARGGWLRWRFDSYNGMVRYGRADCYNYANRIGRAPSGKGWADAETQNTNDLKNWNFFYSQCPAKVRQFLSKILPKLAIYPNHKLMRSPLRVAAPRTLLISSNVSALVLLKGVLQTFIDHKSLRFLLYVYIF